MQRLPALCFFAAAILLFALVTNGFSLTWQTGQPFWRFVREALAVRLASAGLYGAALALCRARGKQQAIAIFVLCLAIAGALSGLDLYVLWGTRPAEPAALAVDLSTQLPGFLLMLLMTQFVCRASRAEVVRDAGAFALSVLLFLLPSLIFGWGVPSCFFDTVCVTTTLFALLAAEPLLDCVHETLRRFTHRP